jgi:hypothetical protein
VARAVEVLVQGGERAVTAVTQVALVRGAVPRARARDVRDLAVVPAGEEARGVGDDVLGIVFADVAVDLLAVRTGLAAARLQVEDECGARDERLPRFVIFRTKVGR